MRTDVAIDKLCNIAPIISEMTEKISSDEEFKTIMKSFKETPSNKVLLLKLFPILLKNYREEIFEMLAVWEDKNVDEIKAQPFAETINQIKALWENKDFRSFFSSSKTNANVADE